MWFTDTEHSFFCFDYCIFLCTDAELCSVLIVTCSLVVFSFQKESKTQTTSNSTKSNSAIDRQREKSTGQQQNKVKDKESATGQPYFYTKGQGQIHKRCSDDGIIRIAAQRVQPTAQAPNKNEPSRKPKSPQKPVPPPKPPRLMRDNGFIISSNSSEQSASLPHTAANQSSQPIATTVENELGLSGEFSLAAGQHMQQTDHLSLIGPNYLDNHNYDNSSSNYSDIKAPNKVNNQHIYHQDNVVKRTSSDGPTKRQDFDVSDTNLFSSRYHEPESLEPELSTQV